MAGIGARIGIYGFGAAAHIITQVAVHQRREVFAFVTPGDEQARAFALDVGASWAGFSDQPPPHPLDCAIIFAPVGRLVPEALSRVVAGGIVVCAGIHMSDIPSFPYRLLWEERVARSVANLTRRDAREFLALAGEVPIRTHVREYALHQANEALDDLRRGRLSGAAVLVPSRIPNPRILESSNPRIFEVSNGDEPRHRMMVRADRAQRVRDFSIRNGLSRACRESDVVQRNHADDRSPESLDGQPSHPMLFHRCQRRANVVVGTAR
jgi:hypothetical protein